MIDLQQYNENALSPTVKKPLRSLQDTRSAACSPRTVLWVVVLLVLWVPSFENRDTFGVARETTSGYERPAGEKYVCYVLDYCMLCLHFSSIAYDSFEVGRRP